ncbi:MAG TPA: hypothetical protein IAC19_09030 [Candidatus Ventricola gallistercoris]|nr:hypothetical protein [Candidatus Ventricola gallistercoris]
MKYLLQVSTGSFSHTSVEAQTVAEKLERCLDRIAVEKVIFGWSPDRAVNESLVGLLEKRGIEKYIWLPVFSEIHRPETSDALVDVTGQSGKAISHLCQGESFDFVCPSSGRNRERAVHVFGQLAGNLPVEGVFIDRIRYASAANGVRSLYGCWCPRCRKQYEAAGVDVQRIRSLSAQADTAPFMPEALENGVYRYRDADVDKLMRVRRFIVSQSAAALCAHFQSLGKKVGVDTFAPGVADFVGQDLIELGSHADFIKPMIYLRTQAPAGVPYELDALGEGIRRRICELWHGDVGQIDVAARQARMLADNGVHAAVGIDANRISGICDADAAYVTRYLDRLEEAGCEEVVLSWDAMRISDEVWAAVASR